MCSHFSWRLLLISGIFYSSVEFGSKFAGLPGMHAELFPPNETCSHFWSNEQISEFSGWCGLDMVISQSKDERVFLETSVSCIEESPSTLE
jgi:hypothetical protein